ncbi:uncharacterized protein LOC120940362 [Rana temporaria]|uniref:uncharacterized protein LOC120940362 n=1 Tax=Rana temporaria TaxID=8407 RepID=UPI001AAE008A|nr:uncharacterized protein LOC120940362 [Rana temporaria]
MSRSGAGASKYKKGAFFEMLDFLRNVMSLRSTATNISETEEETDTEFSQQDPMGETGVTESEAAEDATRAARPIPPTTSVPIRSVGSTVRKRPQKNKLDNAMLSFMEEMKARRPDSNDPFLDPNNEDALFLRSQYHLLQKMNPDRKLDMRLAIGQYIGTCLKASMSGDPVPQVISPSQRQFYPDHPPPAPYTHRFQPSPIPHHYRAPASTAQNFPVPPQAPNYDPSPSQGTSRSDSSLFPTPYYQDL